jgi:hypothetical protein
VNQAVENKFPGASVKVPPTSSSLSSRTLYSSLSVIPEANISSQYGSEASGAGDNRTIPEDEGGEILRNGQPTKARDFEGMGGPEDKAAVERLVRGGDDDVDSIVRQRQKKVGRRSDEDEDEDEESLSK